MKRRLRVAGTDARNVADILFSVLSQVDPKSQTPEWQKAAAVACAAYRRIVGTGTTGGKS